MQTPPEGRVSKLAANRDGFRASTGLQTFEKPQNAGVFGPTLPDL
jgi:hypothetical protein